MAGEQSERAIEKGGGIMGFLVKYVFQCDVCDKVVEIEIDAPLCSPLLQGDLILSQLHAWRIQWNYLVCEKHEVKVLIKEGETVPAGAKDLFIAS